MGGPDDFDGVRRDPDPIRGGRRATALLWIDQQRATELARLRRAAIEEAHQAQGLTCTDIAAALGITKGRVTQIRTGAPARERAFFGVGPVSVGVPLREGTDDRMRSYVDAAGIHSPGSRGVLHYLSHHLPQLYRDTGDTSFSAAIRCDLDGLDVTSSAVLAGPFSW